MTKVLDGRDCYICTLFPTTIGFEHLKVSFWCNYLSLKWKTTIFCKKRGFSSCNVKFHGYCKYFEDHVRMLSWACAMFLHFRSDCFLCDGSSNILMQFSTKIESKWHFRRTLRYTGSFQHTEWHWQFSSQVESKLRFSMHSALGQDGSYWRTLSENGGFRRRHSLSFLGGPGRFCLRAPLYLRSWAKIQSRNASEIGWMCVVFY